jgi:hypothetical protein
MKKTLLLIAISIAFTIYVYPKIEHYLDDSKKIDLLLPRCKNNDNLACIQIGTIYYLKKNYSDAESFYSMACDGGVVEGCLELANTYRVIDSDYEKASEITSQLCQNGNADGCLALGDMYHSGYELKDNDGMMATAYYEKALEISFLACNNGDYHGCANVANIFHFGLGLEKNLPLSIQYLDRACKLGGAWQCREMGNIFEKGKDISQNIDLAEEYNKRACELNPKIGCSAYERLKN